MSTTTATTTRDRQAPAIPPTIGLYEMVLEVDDLDAAERFYTEVLGFEVIDRWGEDRPAVWLALGRESFLGLWSHKAAQGALHNARGGAHVHYAIRVPYGTLPAYEERFTALGVPWERIDFNAENHAIYVDDPDGNVVEFSEWATLWDGTRVENPQRT